MAKPPTSTMRRPTAGLLGAAGSTRGPVEVLPMDRSAPLPGPALQVFEFEIVFDPMPDPVIDGLPEADQELITDLHWVAMDGEPDAEERLRAAIARLPQVASLLNFLTLVLMRKGDDAGAAEVVAQTRRLFPGYLFGFCAEVSLHLNGNRVEEARRLLETGPEGPRLFIGNVKPGVRRFHVTEFGAFQQMVVRYLLMTGRGAEARRTAAMAIEAMGDHPIARDIQQLVEIDTLQRAIKQLKSLPASVGARSRKSRR